MQKALTSNTRYLKIVFFLLALLLIVQLFRIQVIENGKWTVRSAIKNNLRSTYQATRGSVYFDDGSPLAVSELAYSLYALPDAFKSTSLASKNITKEGFAKDFEEIVGVDHLTVLDALNSGKQYVAIARKIKPEVVQQLQQKYPLSDGLWNPEQQFIRKYPNNSLAAKVIGFVRPDDNGIEVGQYGVEQYFDGILRGSDGLFEGQKDDNGQVIVNRDFENVSSKNGINITLTIDRNIQALLEQKLMQWMDITKSKRVTAVVMEVNTGRIIALADVPTYDPNKYWEGELIDCSLQYYNLLHKKCNPDKPVEEVQKDEANKTKQEQQDLIYPDGYQDQLKKLQEEQARLDAEKKKLEDSIKNGTQEDGLTAEEQKKLESVSPAIRSVFRKESLPPSDVYRDDASSALFEMGSMVKVMTLATAYNYGTIPADPNYQLGSHKGCEPVLDVTICTSTKKPESSLSVEEMLRKSDNIGAFRIAQTMPAVDFAHTFQRFGLGKASGVELADEPVFKMKDPENWSKVDLSTGAFGQGSVAFTPIQFTAAWNALASKGAYYKPTVVKSIDDNGKVKTFDDIKSTIQTVTPEAAEEALTVNAIATRNTSSRAKIFYDKYTFSGKTATANIPNPDGPGYLKDALNVGYIGVAPLNNPKFTMMVWFNEPKQAEGGRSPDSISVGQWSWLDIANEMMIKMNIPPQNIGKN